MAWLQRLFGIEKPADAQVNPTPNSEDDSSTDEPSTTNAHDAQIPPERLGLNGEHDQSGLAKRVALAFDEDGRFDDIDSVYVAQTGSTVVLKGDVPDQDTLDSLVEIAKDVTGATNVSSDQVTVG